MAVTRHFRGFLQLLGYRLDIARNLHGLWGDHGLISGQSFFVREKELCKVTKTSATFYCVPVLTSLFQGEKEMAHCVQI